MHILLLWLSAQMPAAEWGRLDDLNILRFLFAAQNESKVAFTYMSGSLGYRVGVYDFSWDKVLEVNDGRITPTVAFVIPWDDGFGLINNVGSMLFRISGDGEFVAKQPWQRLEGWQTSFKLVYASPMKKSGLVAVNILDRSSKKYLLGIMDLKHQSMTTLFERRAQSEDFSYYWLPLEDGWLQIIPQKARFDILNAQTYQIEETLHPGREPWKRKKRSSRSGIYAKLVDQPIQTDHTIYFKWLQYRDPYGEPYEELRLKTLALNRKVSQEAPWYMIGAHAGKKLVYSWEDKELRVIP